MRIGLGQINTIPGDVEGNALKIECAYSDLIKRGAELVLFPELAMVGYGLSDLLLYPSLLERQTAAWAKLLPKIGDVPAIIGCVLKNEAPRGLPMFNGAAWCEQGAIRGFAKKCLLPTYTVFNECRYFEPGEKPCIFEFKGRRVGVLICEDVWNVPGVDIAQRYASDPVTIIAQQKVDLVLCPSASPWCVGHAPLRLSVLKHTAAKCQALVVYCNLAGGNEEMIFDGRSLIVSATGSIIDEAPAFEVASRVVDLQAKSLPALMDVTEIEEIHRALVWGIREYASKTGFSKAVIGLSGGIDSAVVAVLAAEALGPQNVLGVGLPSAISSDHSREDARALAKSLGIEWMLLPIEAIVDAAVSTLAERFEGTQVDLTEENLQARARGLLLMALSNKEQRLLLATSNKSEIAVGYSTLYGDMCGGLAPIGDLYKTQVYALAEHINANRQVIPTSTLTKPPSAELRPDQTDQDTLPPYDVLDALLKAHIENYKGAQELIAAGFDATIVQDTLRRVSLSEYKRKQGPPILRTSYIAFGMGRRVPLIGKDCRRQ